MIKTIGVILIITILGLSFSKPIFAQTDQTKQEKKTQKVKEQIKKLGLGQSVKVKVKLYNETTYQGYISDSNEDNFTVNDKNGNPQTIKYSEVDKVGGKNLSTGAKIAIGAGIGVGATLLILYLIFRKELS